MIEKLTGLIRQLGEIHDILEDCNILDSSGVTDKSTGDAYESIRDAAFHISEIIGQESLSIEFYGVSLFDSTEEKHPLDEMGHKLSGLVKEGLFIIDCSGEEARLEQIEKLKKAIDDAEELTNHYREKGEVL